MPFQAWENLEERHRERTGDQLPEDMRLAILLSMGPTNLEKELTAQQHLFPDYAQMKAHIVTVINSRTRGHTPMMMGNLSDEDSYLHAGSDESVESEDGELYRLEIRNGKKVFTKSRHEPSKGKGGEKGKTDRECFRCGRLGHTRADCRAKTHINRRPTKTAPEGKSVGNCKDEEPRPHKMCHWVETIDLRSFEVLSDHGDEMDGDESTFEITERMPPLPPDSWFKRTEMHCGKFRKPFNEDHQDDEDPFLDCWDGKQEQFDALQPMDPLARNAPKSVPDVKGCLSVHFPVCSVCKKLGVYQRLPMKAPQYDISSEGEDRPSDNSNDEEWWPNEVELNAVTIGNMSIDSKPDSGTGESVVNPDVWPNVDLKPSKGSRKGQRYVGPGGETMDNLGELTVKVRTEQHGGADISSRVTLQGAQGPESLACGVRSD